MLSDYLPNAVNRGPWVTAYTLNELRGRSDLVFVLPIGSMTTSYSEFVTTAAKSLPDSAATGQLLLPPLFHEGLGQEELKRAIIARIRHCFPTFGQDEPDRLKVLELPPTELEAAPNPHPSRLLALSVDTAVEEHGPHLPLATDTIQSYSVLQQLSHEDDSIELCRPLEYGQMTWGLPFGFSIDLTAELLSPYVANCVNALVRWKRPGALYVVDVHGSIRHRDAIVKGLQMSDFDRWAFRWLHEPLSEFASERGDQHAGGVETALVERTGNGLIDRRWFPARLNELRQCQMSLGKAVELSPDLNQFARYVDEHSLNGIVGGIENYFDLDADEMYSRMLQTARQDLVRLRNGTATQSAGEDLW